MLQCAHLTGDAPLLKKFYNDNPMEINEMRSCRVSQQLFR
jgi:hypothetical protein